MIRICIRGGRHDTCWTYDDKLTQFAGDQNVRKNETVFDHCIVRRGNTQGATEVGGSEARRAVASQVGKVLPCERYHCYLVGPQSLFHGQVPCRGNCAYLHRYRRVLYRMVIGCYCPVSRLHMLRIWMVHGSPAIRPQDEIV